VVAKVMQARIGYRIVGVLKIEGFGGRPPVGGRPGARGPPGPFPLNPALPLRPS